MPDVHKRHSHELEKMKPYAAVLLILLTLAHLMCAIEGIQEKFGKFKLGFGGSMYQNRSWSMSQNLKSNNYFTWEGMLKISR
ncbi:hypothetical protein JUNP543_1294 [Acinetobacter baumannii]